MDIFSMFAMPAFMLFALSIFALAMMWHAEPLKKLWLKTKLQFSQSIGGLVQAFIAFFKKGSSLTIVYKVFALRGANDSPVANDMPWYRYRYCH
jgi:hypothetical protein